jgi:hypothetical protein
MQTLDFVVARDTGAWAVTVGKRVISVHENRERIVKQAVDMARRTGAGNRVWIRSEEANLTLHWESK